MCGKVENRQNFSLFLWTSNNNTCKFSLIDWIFSVSPQIVGVRDWAGIESWPLLASLWQGRKMKKSFPSAVATVAMEPYLDLATFRIEVRVIKAGWKLMNCEQNSKKYVNWDFSYLYWRFLQNLSKLLLAFCIIHPVFSCSWRQCIIWFPPVENQISKSWKRHGASIFNFNVKKTKEYRKKKINYNMWE